MHLFIKIPKFLTDSESPGAFVFTTNDGDSSSCWYLLSDLGHHFSIYSRAWLNPIFTPLVIGRDRTGEFNEQLAEPSKHELTKDEVDSFHSRPKRDPRQFQLNFYSPFMEADIGKVYNFCRNKLSIFK